MEKPYQNIPLTLRFHSLFLLFFYKKQQNIQQNKQQQSIKLKVTYDKKPPFDYRFYKRAVVIHFKNKENFLNESKFLYEIAREILIENEPMRIATTQIKKDGTLVNHFNLLVFNLSKIFLNKSFIANLTSLSGIINGNHS